MKFKERFSKSKFPKSSIHYNTYSEIGVDVSQMEGQFHCHLPVTSNSPMVTRGRSRCLFESNTHLIRFLTLKMQESRSTSCRCEFCKKIKGMLGKKSWKVHKDSKFKSNRSVPHGEVVSTGRQSIGSCGGTQNRRRNWRHN